MIIFYLIQYQDIKGCRTQTLSLSFKIRVISWLLTWSVLLSPNPKLSLTPSVIEDENFSLRYRITQRPISVQIVIGLSWVDHLSSFLKSSIVMLCTWQMAMCA